MHLESMLHETKQLKTLDWDGVLMYCLGYYGTITEDHIKAVKKLERYGFLRYDPLA